MSSSKYVPDLEARLLRAATAITTCVRAWAEVPDNLNDSCMMLLGRLISLPAELAVNTGDPKKLGMYSGSNVTYNMSVLVTAGYIEKAKKDADGRRTQIVLTEKGQTVGRRVAAIIGQIEVQFAPVFSGADCIKTIHDLELFVLEPQKNTQQLELLEERN